MVNGGTASSTTVEGTTRGLRGMLAKEVTKWATNERRVAGHGRRRTVRMRESTGDRAVVRPCVWLERSLGGRGVAKKGVRWRRWEGVHGVAVARGFELRIATALSDRGVGSSTTNSNSSVDRLRVHAGVDERHLLHDECEGIKGRNDRALLRAGVRGNKMRNMWKVGIVSFWCHRGRGKEKLNNRQRREPLAGLVPNTGFRETA
jgi:hypothetical protein